MLLGIGIWSGIENAARIGWDAILGFSNLVRGRPFRHGMEPFELGSIIDSRLIRRRGGAGTLDRPIVTFRLAAWDS